MKSFNVAIVGATGMVGRSFLKILEERKFPIRNLYLFASSKSKGKSIPFNGATYTVEELTEQSFDRGIDIALFSAGGSASKKFAPIAASKGCTVIDNSSYFRMDQDVPLIVPEVNPQDIKNSRGIIANPNCSTIQAVVALKPIHEKYHIKRIVYCTYQSVSGAGMGGYTDLEEGLKGNLPKKFPHQIANNCIPHIDEFTESGYTKEELKMIAETKKILHDESLKITATAVRVPVFNSHSECINVETEKNFELKDVVELLKSSNGIVLQDDFTNNEYPLAANATGLDSVFVGRIRRDFSVDNGINMWVVADNIRKGAATNAVQIAELLIGGM